MRFEEALKAMREGKKVRLVPGEPSEGTPRDNVHIKDNKMYMDSCIYSYPVIAKLTYKDILSECWDLEFEEYERMEDE